MSVSYKSIQWNQKKLIYDIVVLLSVVLYIVLFESVARWVDSGIEWRGVRIRAFGSAAFILLHFILSIGPLTRLNRKFYPLLFNRRHLGILMFLLALNHARLSLSWYHDFGDTNPLVSLFISNSHYDSFIQFPFEVLGVIALAILFVMASTSHDFWLVNLTAPLWKALHSSVYLAYGLLVGHVILGSLQANKHPLLNIFVALGLIWVLGLHLVTGLRELNRDRDDLAITKEEDQDFVEVGEISEIPENQAKVVTISGERVAIFKYEGKISAISNVCQHQNGPLGEGRIIKGCVTCPWHGYQYRVENGASPPPFTEKVPTFDVKLEGDRIFVRTIPHPPGTPVTPAKISNNQQPPSEQISPVES